MRKVLILLAITLLPWVASVLGYWAGIRINLAAWMPPTPAAPEEALPLAETPREWREDRYLLSNPDVAVAVRSGQFRSGYDHYLRAGLREGRRGGLPDGMTLPPAPPVVAVAPAPAATPVSTSVQEPAPAAASPASAPEPTPATLVVQAPPPSPEAPVHYVVRNGGALARVAEINGITVMDLLRANPGLKDGWMAPGTTINLPAIREQALAPTPAAAPPPVLAAVPLVPVPAPKPGKPGGTSAGPAPMAAAAQSGGAAVQGIRMGEHPPVTRLVLDLSGPVGAPTVIRPNANSVVLALAGVRWNTASRWSADTHPVLRSYQAANGPEGSRLDIQARTAVEIRQIAVHLPNGERGYRVIVDLVPAGR